MDYSAALARPIPGPASGSPVEKQAIERFPAFFAELTADSIRDKMAETYAEDVWFNDSLKTIEGREELEEYLLETARLAETTVEVDNVARSGDDYYYRWRMTIRFAKLKNGEPQDSIGMSHIRFNADGLIVLHQDYWDAAGGFFEHVPVLGWGIRRVKKRL